MRVLRSAALVSFSLFGAVAATSQSVLVVGPGGYATIQGAVDAASNGDIVRIAPGTYGVFQLSGKGLTLIADQPGTVRIRNMTFNENVVAIDLDPSLQLRLVDLIFEDNPTVGILIVGIFHGITSIEGCTFVSGMLPVLDVGGNAVVVMRRCQLQGSSDAAMRVVGPAHLLASQCTFTGAPVVGLATSGAALLVEGALAFLSDCTLTGGSYVGPAFSYTAGSGVLCHIPARVWVVDCTVQGGDSSAANVAPGHAIANGGLTTYHRGTVRGGIGPTGPAAAVPGSSVPEPLLGVTSSPAGLQLGANFDVVLRGAPGDILVTFGTIELQLPQIVPILAQPVVGFLAPTGIVVDAAIAGPTGTASYSFLVPSVPAVRHVGVWFRGIDLATWPLQASPIVGGVIR